MSSPRASEGPGWTRRIPGTALLQYFLLSAGLWAACLSAWEFRQPELAVGLLAAGAFVPVLWLAVRLRNSPLWALALPGDPGETAGVLREVLAAHRPVSVVTDQFRHATLFRGCETLLRIEDPVCLLGVFRTTQGPGSTVLLLPESKDRQSIDRLRCTIASRLRHG